MKFFTYSLRKFSVPGPDFVGAVEDEDFVYFFFREEAVEFMNCGKVSLKKFFNKSCLSIFFILYIIKKVSVAKAEWIWWDGGGGGILGRFD